MLSPETGIGIGIALAAATLDSVGLSLQKLAHVRILRKRLRIIPREDVSFMMQAAQGSETELIEIREQPVLSFWERCRGKCGYLVEPLWVLGFSIFLFGNIVNSVALNFAPESLVSLLGAWSLAVNGCVAPRLLGEAFSRLDAAAAVLISLGVGCTIFSSGRTTQLTLDELLKRFSHPQVTCYILSVVVVAILLRLWLAWRGSRWRRLWPALGALAGSLTLATAKATMGLISSSFSLRENEFESWKAMIVVLVFALSLPVQVHWVNASLALNEALFHIPIYFVVWNLFSITTGAVVYQEFSKFGTRKWMLFPLGVSLLFTGVALSAKRQSGETSTSIGSEMVNVEKVPPLLTSQSPPCSATARCMTLLPNLSASHLPSKDENGAAFQASSA